MMSEKFAALDEEETILARTLLRKNLITEKALDGYIGFRKSKDEKGKTYLGKILVDQGFITEDDLQEFVFQSDELHMEFCDTLLDKGYLTEDQLESVWRRRDDTGEDVISILEELGIMTRDNFSRIYDKNTSAGNLRLGEWLVLNKKVTNDQVLAARDFQRINNLVDYLVYHKLVSSEELEKLKSELEGAVSEIINRPGAGR
jgi:hypothetical protein